MQQSLCGEGVCALYICDSAGQGQGISQLEFSTVQKRRASQNAMSPFLKRSKKLIGLGMLERNLLPAARLFWEKIAHSTKESEALLLSITYVVVALRLCGHKVGEFLKLMQTRHDGKMGS